MLIKPDAISKALIGNILTRFSETKLEIVAARMASVSRDLAEEHYKHLRKESFFERLIKFIMGEFHDGPKVMALVYRGEDAVRKCRELAGATHPEEASATSIRGSMGRVTQQGVYENLVHVSESPREAKREIQLWFEPSQLLVEAYPTREIVVEEQKKIVWA